MYYFLFLCLIIILFFIIIACVKKNRLLLNTVYRYEDIINKQGMNNHEYNNQLMVLSGYLECKNYDEVRSYLNTIIKDHRTGEDYDVKQLARFNSGGLKKLLHFKIAKMEDLKIEYFLNITDDFKNNIDKLSVYNYSDMTKVFGVLLDNSIDASKKNKSEIDMDFKTKDKYLIITIKNIAGNLDINNIGKTGYTTKGVGHGFGLQVVNMIIRKNSSIDVSFDLEDKQFVQTIIIDIK